MSNSPTVAAPRTRRGSRGNAKPDHDQVSVSKLWPSPENNALYRPVNPKDPEIVALADSIRLHGVLEPLVVTSDGFLVSGHRRYVAAKLAGLQSVPVRILPYRRADDINAFVRLLREHNRQREKTNAERMREAVVEVNPDEAHQELYEYRRAKAAIDCEPLTLGKASARCSISPARQPLLRTVLAIINGLRPSGS